MPVLVRLIAAAQAPVMPGSQSGGSSLLCARSTPPAKPPDMPARIRKDIGTPCRLPIRLMYTSLFPQNEYIRYTLPASPAIKVSALTILAGVLSFRVMSLDSEPDTRAQGIQAYTHTAPGRPDSCPYAIAYLPALAVLVTP